MDGWPTEQQVKRTRLSALLLTLAAACDGAVMLLSFSPVMVLCEIVLASCAVAQCKDAESAKLAQSIDRQLARCHYRFPRFFDCKPSS